MAMKILFVCTGNTCRSIMAEALMGKMSEGRDLKILSAGLAALPGSRASSQARETMKREGLNIDLHQARPLSDKLIQQSDLVLTMTRQHRDYIHNVFPEIKEKVFTLKQFAGGDGDGDVADPFGQPVSVYQACSGQLKTLIEKVLQKIE